MRAETHVLGAVNLSLLLFPHAGLVPALVAGGASLIPDIDHPGSTIGRNLPVISDVISFSFGHRGLCHSLLFGLLLAVPLWYYHFIFMPFVILGFFSHLFLDLLTPSGIPLFYPVNQKYSVPLFKTGSIGEKLLALLFVLVFFIIK